MNQIDLNDLKQIEEQYGKVKRGIFNVRNKDGKINPHLTRVELESGKLVSVFHVKPVYYETASRHWRPLSEVTNHHGNKSIELNEHWWKIHPNYLNWLDKRQKLLGGSLLIPSIFQSTPTPYAGVVRSIHESLVPLKIGLTTDTYYPDPGSAGTTVDGSAFRDSGGGTFNDLVRGNGTAADNVANTEIYAHLGAHTSSNTWRYMWRNYTLFDTSSLPDTDSISSATLSLYLTGQGSPENFSNTVNVTECSPASNTTISSSDYQNVSNTKLATGVTYASMSTGNRYDFDLNSSGIAAVSKTGITKFSARFESDIDNSAPTWVSGGYDSLTFGSADASGTTTDPKLVVVHAAATSPSASPSSSPSSSVSASVSASPSTSPSTSISSSPSVSSSPSTSPSSSSSASPSASTSASPSTSPSTSSSTSPSTSPSSSPSVSSSPSASASASPSTSLSASPSTSISRSPSPSIASNIGLYYWDGAGWQPVQTNY